MEAASATGFIALFRESRALLTLPLTVAHMGSEEPVAQPVEHLTFNQGVSGSNPDGLTNNSKIHRHFLFPPKTPC